MHACLYRLRAVRVEHAAREHAARVVLDLAELDIPAGGVTAIVGPNGAGKTTLLRVLGFLLPPTAGSVEFQGKRLSYREPDVRACRRQVTLVAQAPLLFHRSVRANIAYGLRAHGHAEDGRLDAALAAVGLAGFSDRPAWKLSAGEVQRVAIARALAIDPSVYLFDEPTANIDRQYVAIVESLIANLGATGKTVLLTTHNLEQAYRLGDSLVALAEGRRAPFPLVNLLRGTSRRIDDTQYFLSGALRIEIPDGATPRTIAIDPDAIIVSRAPLHSSARNCFPGSILKVEHDERGLLLTMDCGRPFVARVTRHSYEEMALNLGTPVYITFKSSAIHMLDDRPADERE